MAAALYECVDAPSRHLTERKISYKCHTQMDAAQYEYVDATARYITAGKISYIYHM
jgi:hypothetical protein